ncbi:hypothetical protein BD310DRAFT_931947 [Dichomitus squalens]|uniref:Uncharacterized protein n=1 Tax=Dichomitus squalens TaxID=114155 RepID=A0A4Q9PPU8_9APHY|nr:hypothetical protein BD310DRAFT_931947 [Dichomitus squalens]
MTYERDSHGRSANGRARAARHARARCPVRDGCCQLWLGRTCRMQAKRCCECSLSHAQLHVLILAGLLESPWQLRTSFSPFSQACQVRAISGTTTPYARTLPCRIPAPRI